jgi:hypothetical protein
MVTSDIELFRRRPREETIGRARMPVAGKNGRNFRNFGNLILKVAESVLPCGISPANWRMAAAARQSYDGGTGGRPGRRRRIHVGDMGGSLRYLTVGAGAALAALVLSASHDRLAAREFRAADIQEESYPTVQALMFMDKLVAERTGGRHSIRVFHSRQLGEESQTIEQTRVGAIDLNRINVAAIGDVAPVLNILAQPFLFR